MDLISDRPARDLAETTFDRNVVVIAGAGTGKTTLLVNRLIHLLMKEPEPVPVTRIVALTFTNKAATEMKVRLRERLTALARTGADGGPASDGGAVSLDDLRGRYRLTSGEIVARARAALQDLEKAQIGTLHSFAAHLLRLHPLESGVDPAFQEDDGSRFDEHFAMHWDVWTDQELGRKGTHHGLWRRLLRLATLDDLKQFASALCSEMVDVHRLEAQLMTTQGNRLLMEWFTRLRDRALALLTAHDRPKRRKIEQMLASSHVMFSLLIEKGPAAQLDLSAADRGVLLKDPGKAVDGWEPADFTEATGLIELAQHCLQVDQDFFMYALKVLTPFVTDVRRSFVGKGWLSFDGLLARARILLHEHPAVRERIKQEYRSVLVDEFQDTDPVQYEIILAVSERDGTHAGDWKEMALEPGKLFIVGDPKQSIYAFRRADIEAFDRVVQKIEAENGIVETLTTNFRSDAAVLGPINDVFDRVFQRRPHVQPGNVRLDVRPNRRPAPVEAGVRLTLVSPNSPATSFDAADATRAEAEVLARWLRDDLFSRPAIKPGHVAFLFRKLTQADTYLDALRRHGIAYVIEGEKHFYRRQEVIDLMNVLRVLDHPHDAIALVGVLRSALGGLTDRDIYDLRQIGGFDYRCGEQLRRWAHPCAPAVRRLYERLATLHREVAFLPPAEAIQHLFDRLPLLELAGASLHGEQAVANLRKVQQTAVALADRPHLTLNGFVELMIGRLDEQPDEAESPLVEESMEAIQVLTIHKAKGLEFPIVVLPGLHQGSGRERSAPAISYDWSSGLYGLTLGSRRTFGSVFVAEKQQAREEAERRRVLYVGMTRAKDLLLLSGGLTARSGGDTILGLFHALGKEPLGDPGTDTLTVGASTIRHTVVEAPHRTGARRMQSETPIDLPVDPHATAALWGQRTANWIDARSRMRRLTPTMMTAYTGSTVARQALRQTDPEVGRLAGILAHRVLEHWDFAEDPAGFEARSRDTVERTLADQPEELKRSVTISLQELWRAFGQSTLYSTFRSATILGREIPFLIPWGAGQVMEGIIDIVYRLDGEVWIADYKTDAVTAEEAPACAERYRTQGRMYTTAAMQCLGIDRVRFHCVFLRCGTSVEL